MSHESVKTKEKLATGGLLLILVGESGAGKSTFCEYIDRPEGYYCSSEALERELLSTNQPINHDTIHAFANKAYGENPEWQVPRILSSLKGRSYLILDGPRRVDEVKALKRDHANTVVIRISTSPEDLFYVYKIINFVGWPIAV